MRVIWSVLFASVAVVTNTAAPLRFAGSSTVRGMLETAQPQIEAAGHCSIEFSSSGSVPGLLALAGGAADVAMLSMPLEDAANAVNKKSPGRIDPNAFHAVQIGEAQTVFIVNPHNRVRHLSTADLVGVLTGTIANWKEVGGDDAPILVVSIGSGGAFLEKLLAGRPITAQARTVARASQIAALVAAEPNAIGIVSASHPRGQTTVVQTDAHIAAPLLLVTRGDPSVEIAAVEKAARDALNAR